MAIQSKIASKAPKEYIKARTRSPQTEPPTKWNYTVVRARRQAFLKLWRWYTQVYKGDAEYAIVGLDWVIHTKGKHAKIITKFYVHATRKNLPAQCWYPIYKKAVEFEGVYMSLRDLVHLASQNYTLYGILRFENGQTVFETHRLQKDVRFFRHRGADFRVIGGDPSTIPWADFEVDADKVCKYFVMWLYTLPGYL